MVSPNYKTRNFMLMSFRQKQNRCFFNSNTLTNAVAIMPSHKIYNVKNWVRCDCHVQCL